MRKHLIGANWKMHKNPAGTNSFFEAFLPLAGHSEHCEIVICPPFLDVENAVKATRGTTIRIGAQDLYWENDGPFTGEVSGPMIKASGCSHVIVGHSERRRYFGDTNETVLKKTIAALDAGLTPIVCVGERQKKNVEGSSRSSFDTTSRDFRMSNSRESLLATSLFGRSERARLPRHTSRPPLIG